MGGLSESFFQQSTAVVSMRKQKRHIWIWLLKIFLSYSEWDRLKNSNGFLIYCYPNEKDIFGIEVFTKNIFPPSHNRFLGYSYRVFSPFRQNPNDLVSPLWVKPVKFISLHSLLPPLFLSQRLGSPSQWRLPP